MWRESCIARVIATAIFLSINIAVRVAGGHGCWMALGEIASMHHIITGHPPTLPSFLSFFLPSNTSGCRHARAGCVVKIHVHISFTKNPMKPMITKPRTVRKATFVYSTSRRMEERRIAER